MTPSSSKKKKKTNGTKTYKNPKDYNPEDRVKCPECDVNVHQHSLGRHIRLVHKKFECKDCDENFENKQNYDAHMELYHEDEATEEFVGHQEDEVELVIE